MLKRYAIWDKESPIITPIGEYLSADEWKARYPVAKAPKTNAEGDFITTKEDTDAHGFGLKSIENTAKKYKGERIAKCEDGVFTLVVRLNSR